MINSKKQAVLPVLVLVYVLVCSILVFTYQDEKKTPPEIETPRSSFYQKENVQSRQEYEQEMLVNPATGKVPANIRKQELEFAREVNLQNTLNKTPRSASSGNGTKNHQLLWLPVGPENIAGRTRAIALDIRNEQIILAGGVSGGVWKSENLGQNWFKTTASDQLQSVTTITQDIRTGKEDIWYYGTGELVGNSSRAPGAPFRGDGIFKSTNGGDSWEPLPSTQSNSPGIFNSPFQYVWDITTNPNNLAEDEVLAAIYGAIVRSTDGGQTWTTVLGTDLINNPPTFDLNNIPAEFFTDIHRTESGVFYATLSSATNMAGGESRNGGIYRSEDGQNWQRILSLFRPGEESFRRIEIASSRSNPGLLYFLAESSKGYRLWKYVEGEGFTDYSANVPIETEELEAFDSQGSYNLTVAIHPTNPNVVFIGGTNLYRSTDGFATADNISWIGGYDPESENISTYPNHHPDQHAIHFIHAFPDALISTNDGGVFITSDSRAEKVTYIPLNNTFVTTQFYTASYSRYPLEEVVLGGTQDNGSILTLDKLVNQGPNGIRILGGDGGFTASTPYGYYYYLSFQNSRIFRLTLNRNAEITSFARVDPVGGGTDPSQSYLFVNPYVLDPNNANRMYLAGGDFVWYNQNLSQIPAGSQSPARVNWKRLTRTEVQAGVISAIQVSTNPKDIVYYGTGNGQLFRIDNAHSDIYSVKEITGQEFPVGGYIRCIAIDPTDANHILVAFSNYGVKSLFRSTDGGTTFTHVSGNLEEFEDGTGNGPSFRWAAIVPRTDGTKLYYAATSTGLYSTTSLEGNVVWEQESPEGIGNMVVNMIDFRQSDGKMVAATHGNGLYTAQADGVVPNENLVVEEDFEIANVYPNPFADEVTIEVNAPRTRLLIIRVYDSRGNEVKRVTSNLAFVGQNDFFWDGTNSLGQPVGNGVYLIRVTYEQKSYSRKVVLQRE